MPTKAAKKSSKGKPQQPQVFSSAPVDLGPPFAGQGPYAGGSWGQFPRDDGRLEQCRVFWRYAKHFPSTGGVVSQLGAEPGAGSASCNSSVGYRYDFTPTAGGEYTFVLTLNLGPVTRRPRYGQVSTLAYFFVTDPLGDTAWDDDYPEPPSNTGITLCVRPQIRANQRYILVFGVHTDVRNAGYQSYGEVIVNSASLKQYLPYGAQAARAARPAGARRNRILSALRDPADQQGTREVSLQEGVERGVGYQS